MTPIDPYSVLAVARDASREEIQAAYVDRIAALAHTSAGTSADIYRFRQPALDILERAWATLRDEASRRSYDQDLAATVDDEPDDNGSSQPLSAQTYTGNTRADTIVAGIEAFADWLGPSHRRSRDVRVPGLVGKTVQEARYLAMHAGVRTEVVQLTAHPAPVDGRVLVQEPSEGRLVRRDTRVVLAVIHPTDSYVAPPTR